jgi:dTDP-4-amino-4,6-dideoxygalactose transaminase
MASNGRPSTQADAIAGWTVPLADVVVPEADIAEVAEAYRSGWLSMGPRTDALERAFAIYTGAQHAVAVSSGTAALHLACLAAGLGPGDDVIVPSLTFVATVNAIAYSGATPVFADVAGLDSPWISAGSCAAAITPRTRAIMTMAYGGHPGDVTALRDLAGRHGLLLIEDAAHALGARLGGQHAGTFGAAGAFSFFANKNLAIGEGGMLVTGDGDLAARARLLRSHGMTSLSWDRHRGHAAGYDVVALGFNYRMDEPRAALALARLRRLDDDNRRRARLDARYRAHLEPLGVICPRPGGPSARHAHHLFTAVLPPDADRDQVRAELARRRVQTSLHYPPVHRFSIYADDAPELPTTDEYARRALTLPLFAHMSGAQQRHVLDTLRAALARRSRPSRVRGRAESPARTCIAGSPATRVVPQEPPDRKEGH